MGFLTGILKKVEKENKSKPVLAAVIQNTVSSEIYQDMLRENGIPFICRQQGAGGYIKILTGGLFIADNIYVSADNLDRAKEIYNIYIETDSSAEFADSEE